MSQPQGQLATRRVSRKEAYGAAILGFILEPLWSDYDCAAPRRAQREGEEGPAGEGASIMKWSVLTSLFA